MEDLKQHIKNIIKGRRSIRKYKKKDVPDKIIYDLIECASYAPSGCNIQPWRFLIIKSKNTKQLLKHNRVFNQTFVYDAPVIIVCCADIHAYYDLQYIDYLIQDGYLPNNIKEIIKNEFSGKEYFRAVRDLSIASTFIILRAYEIGLGCCFVGWFDEKKLRNILEIPENLIIPYVITLGYPNEIPPPRPRRKLEEIIINWR